jgi:hypothetical protein
MKNRFWYVIFIGFLCGFIGPFPGLFSLKSAKANVVGADTQNFNPITSGLDFVTVQSSATLSPWVFNFGYFLNYAVNSLPEYEEGGSRTNFSDSLLSANLPKARLPLRLN